jgi:hypothetical protein
VQQKKKKAAKCIPCNERCKQCQGGPRCSRACFQAGNPQVRANSSCGGTRYAPC